MSLARRVVQNAIARPSNRCVSTSSTLTNQHLKLSRSSRPTAALTRRNPANISKTSRRWKSSPHAEEEVPVSTPDSETHLANVALASALLGFCFFVFTYSIRAVGRPDVTEDGEDPLGQLKAEAQEARDHRAAQGAQRMTPEEAAALESGFSSEGGEVAVAAPAEIAQQLEDEANMRIFGGKTESKKTKKPWWRFGF